MPYPTIRSGNSFGGYTSSGSSNGCGGFQTVRRGNSYGLVNSGYGSSGLKVSGGYRGRR